MKNYLILFLTIFCSTVVFAQTNSKTTRDSLRKVFYGNYDYTHSYGFENFDMPDGTHMEVIPLSDEVTYYELELYRYGSFTRQVTSNKDVYWLSPNIEYGIWRIEGDTLYLKVTDLEYESMFFTSSLLYNGGTYCVSVENPVEEKLFITSDHAFMSGYDCVIHPQYCIYYSRRDY